MPRPHIPFGAVPYVPPLWRESRVGLEAAQLLRSPVWRGAGVAPGEGRPVLLVPGFMAGDGSLATMTKWLRVQRLPDAAGRHPRQRRLLGGGLRAARGAPGGARRPHRPAGRDHRPEPRRRARPRGRRAAARPGVRDRDARRAVGVDAPRPPARAAPGRRARRARHRPRPRPVLHELPARAVLREFRADLAAPFPADVRYTARLLAHGRDRRLARLPGPGSRRARRDPRLALRHGGQRGRVHARSPARWPRFAGGETSARRALRSARRTSTPLGGELGVRWRW